MLRPFDIHRLHPDQFEFLWRTILRREHGSAYRRFDGLGIDCLTGSIAYQFYSYQEASWAKVQEKFRQDLEAACVAFDAGLAVFTKWIFVSTFPFKEPRQGTWLEAQKANAPFEVEIWGDEDMLTDADRQADAERIMGLVNQAFDPSVQIGSVGILSVGNAAPGIEVHGGIHTYQGPPRRPLVGVPWTLGEDTITLAWDGDMDHLRIEDAKEVTGDELVAINCVICRYRGDPQQPVWIRIDDPSGLRRDVWMVHGSTRRRLRSAQLKHEISFLTVGPRREVTCLPFCSRCGRSSGSGNNCAQCGIILHRCSDKDAPRRWFGRAEALVEEEQAIQRMMSSMSGVNVAVEMVNRRMVSVNARVASLRQGLKGGDRNSRTKFNFALQGLVSELNQAMEKAEQDAEQMFLASATLNECHAIYAEYGKERDQRPPDAWVQQRAYLGELRDSVRQAVSVYGRPPTMDETMRGLRNDLDDALDRQNRFREKLTDALKVFEAILTLRIDTVDRGGY